MMQEGAVGSNLQGKWGGTSALTRNGGDPRDFVQQVQECLSTHAYCFFNTQGDQHWTVDPNDPSSLQSKCSEDCLARFLLGVEKGCILGTEGWDAAYDKPLGDPLGAAQFKAKSASAPATLTRSFQSGTKVVFTYQDGVDPEGKMRGSGEVWWGGVKPPLPPPPPPPPSIGSCASSVLAGTTFANGAAALLLLWPHARTALSVTLCRMMLRDVLASSAYGCVFGVCLTRLSSQHSNRAGEVSHEVTATAGDCCALCAHSQQCTQWAWHTQKQNKYPPRTCHLHSSQATKKSVSSVVAGVMNRTVLLGLK
jgi:hypothetical protein